MAVAVIGNCVSGFFQGIKQIDKEVSPLGKVAKLVKSAAGFLEGVGKASPASLIGNLGACGGKADDFLKLLKGFVSLVELPSLHNQKIMSLRCLTIAGVLDGIIVLIKATPSAQNLFTYAARIKLLENVGAKLQANKHGKIFANVMIALVSLPALEITKNGILILSAKYKWEELADKEDLTARVKEGTKVAAVITGCFFTLGLVNTTAQKIVASVVLLTTSIVNFGIEVKAKQPA